MVRGKIKRKIKIFMSESFSVLGGKKGRKRGRQPWKKLVG
tara:strand:- start:278 stop:397 length:120 start_codon:yes stop_codon:yes gene_type:complete